MKCKSSLSLSYDVMWMADFATMCIYYGKQVLTFFWEKVLIAIFVGLIALIVDVYHAQEIALTALIGLMVLDFILGFYRAIKHWEVCSWKIRFWAGKFIVFGIIILTWYWLDQVFFKTNMERGFQYFFILYLWVGEWISVLEHIAAEWKVKLPLLGVLKKKQRQLEDVKDFKDIYDLITKWK